MNNDEQDKQAATTKSSKSSKPKNHNTPNVKASPSTSKPKAKKKITSSDSSPSPAKKKKLPNNHTNRKSQSPVFYAKDSLDKSLADDKDDDWDDENDQDTQLAIPSDLPNYANKFGIEEVKNDPFKLCAAHVNLQYMIIDEICLEGLDGITLEALWTRISNTTKQPLPFPIHVERYVWNIIKSRTDIEFYKLKDPRDKLLLYDRHEDSDPDLGAALDPVVIPVDIYPYSPVKHDTILGSTISFETRTNISDEVRKLTIEEAELMYGLQLIMVGTQKMRKRGLMNSITDPQLELTQAQYCLLERIGRSREQGEITQGKVSLQIISRDPKILFYNRKILLENKLITKQAFYVKTNPSHQTTGSLLHLFRFYNENKTKTQIMTEQIVEVLRERPLHQMEYTEAKIVFGHTRALRKLFKLQEFQKFVRTDVQRKYRELYPDASIKQWKHKGSDRERNIRVIELINPNINVSGAWYEEDPKDESSDDEETKQIIYNMPLLHQVYDYIKSGGPQGRSLKEIQRNKGLDFYTIRAAVKKLLKQNVIVGIKIDVGRQRMMKYQTLTSTLPEEDSTNKNSPESSAMHKQLTNESIDFLSNLLNVEPECLLPAPSVIEIEDDDIEEIGTTKGQHALIKKIRRENRQGKQKRLGYESKAGESLLNQLLTHKEKLKLDASYEAPEEDISEVNETIIDNIEEIGDTSQKSFNSSLLEKIFKNQHEYETAENRLTLINELEEGNLKQVCEEICLSGEIMNRTKHKRRKRMRRRLVSKIKLECNLRRIEEKLVYKDDFKDLSSWPLKFLSEDVMLNEDRCYRFRNKMLKIVKPILSHFKYRVTVLKPKKSFMCKPRVSKNKLMEFSADHPLMSTLSNNNPVKIENEWQKSDGIDYKLQEEATLKPKDDDKEDNKLVETTLKRKGDDITEEDDDTKKIKLSDSTVSESFTPVISSIYMGPKPKVVYHFVDDDNVEITIIRSTTPEEFEKAGCKYIKEENATLRTLKRASHIVDAVRQEKVITDIHRLHRMIESLDKEEGYMVKVDKKSMDRIYTRLVRTSHINMLHIHLKLSETKRNAVVICDPSITIPHTMIDSVIEQMKVRFFLTAKKKEWEPPAIKSGSTEKDEGVTFESSEITSSVGELKLLSSNETSYVYNRNIGKDYGFAPKFMRLRLLHEFLFYVIYGYSYGQEVDTIKQTLKDLGVVMNDNEIKELPRMYCKEVSWKMFIPPLPKHNGWPEGWALVCDLLLRLPLSLFVKVYNVSYIIPELPNYLSHPVKQYYLVKHLPLDIRNGLLLQRKYIFSIHESLARLCYIGILQFGPQKLREKDQLFIYLNRNATLLDTTTNIAGYHYVEEKEYQQLKYSFNTAVDVESYWCDMWNICAHSKLGVRNIVAGTYITIELVDTKPTMIEAMKPKTSETALKNDNGFVPGDKRGAAGLDSALWAHIKRNWNWSNRINKNKSYAYQKDNVKEESKMTPSSVTKKSIKSKKKNSKKSNADDLDINLELDTLTQSRRRTYKRTKIVAEKREHSAGRKGKYFVRKVLPRSDTKKKKDYDSIDKTLMATLKQSRSEWSENEDKVLQICQIMATFLCPNPRKQCIPYTVVRDILHKVSPCSANKTSAACHRRLNVIFGLQDERDFLHQIVRSLRVIPFVMKYILKTIDRTEANISVPEKQLFGIFVFLVTYFYSHQHEINHIFEALAYKYKITTNPHKVKDDNNLTIAENVNIPQNNSYTYSIGPMEIISYECVDMKDEKPKINKLYPDLSEFPKTEKDVMLDTIKSIIHSTVGTKQEEISWSYQLFRVYQNYSDEMLRIALTEIQNAQMVSHKKVYTKRQDSEGLLITTKLFHFSFNYSFAQITNFPLEIFVEANEILLGLAKQLENPANIEKVLPMECFEQGHSVGLAEISTSIKAQFTVDIPKEVLLLNPNIADHTELIRELAERYKKMLTLVKQGKYFKEDETENQYSNNENDSGDQVDGSKQEKKYASTRQPMIQRFLKSWFLSDEVDEVEEDTDSKSSSNPSKDENKKIQDEKKTVSKFEKRKKHYTEISSEESKKILESLNPNLFSEKDAQIKSTNNVEPHIFLRKTNILEPFHPIPPGNDLTFEDYEKKLENLLTDRMMVLETDNNDTENDSISEDEVASTHEDIQDSSLTLTDFNDSNTSILEKYLSNQRRLANKLDPGQDVIDYSFRGQKSFDKFANTNSNIESDDVTNARIQYLMNEELTVEQIMEQMLEECPLEDRKVPKPVHLARLLVKGLFPELDEDEERLEQLHQHFVIICPDTNLILSETTKNFDFLHEEHAHVCKNLLKKVQMDIIISDNLIPTNDVINELKKMGSTDADIQKAENLIEFVSKKHVIGASIKQLKEQFPDLQKLKLSTLLNTLTKLNIFIRAGINHLVYVHHKFRKHWLVESCTLGDQDRLKLKEAKAEESTNEDLALLSQSLESLGSYTKIKLKIVPWARIDGTLNLKVFEKWMCTVLGHCLSNQMIPLKCLISMCCYLKPVDVYYLIECLQEMGCVHMLTYELEKPDLFSLPTYDTPVQAQVTHDFEDIFIETDPFAVVKLGALLNKKFKAFEFPSDEAKKHGTF